MAFLADLGVSRAILSLGFRADAVIRHLEGKSAALPLPVETVVEPEPRGTAGGVRLAARHGSTDPILVLNGDTWVEADYRGFLASHRRRGRPCSILCAKVGDARAYGRIEIGGDGVITQFSEKNPEITGAAIVSAGIYLFSPAALALLESTPGPSLETDFFGRQAPGWAHGYVDKSLSFIDIGTPSGLAAASARLAQDNRRGG